MHMPFLKFRSSDGFTVVEGLVGAAILGIAVAITSKYFTDVKLSMYRAKLKMELSEVRSSLRSAVSCDRTLAGRIADDGTVTCNGRLDLKNADNRSIGNVMAGWSLSVTCTNTMIAVRAQKMAGNKIVKDPVTGEELDYNNAHFNPLFGSGSAYGLCENSFRKNKRVRVIEVVPPDVTLTSADCAKIKPSGFPPMGSSPSSPEAVDLGNRLKRVQKTDVECLSYCSKSYYIAGYMADCSSSGVTCVCVR